MRVDFSEVQEFEPLPSGVYAVRITKVEEKQKPGGEYPYLNWEMTVIDGEFADRKLWECTSFAPKALFKLKGLLECLDGVELDSAELDFEPQDYVGRELLVEVVVGQYNGKPTNSIENYKSA